jgi:hypothetical protein
MGPFDFVNNRPAGFNAPDALTALTEAADIAGAALT